MKRILAILFTLSLLTVLLAGCGEREDDKKNDGAPGAENGDTTGGESNGTENGNTTGGESNGADEGLFGEGALENDGSITGEDTTGVRGADLYKDGDDDTIITHRNGNLYGKAYLTPETERSANAQLRSNGRSLTGIPNDELYSDDARYQQMLSNGRVHDTDGFLFDGENTSYNTLR